MYRMDDEWLRTLRRVRDVGREVSPRGKRVKELDHHCVRVDMRYPVLTNPNRKLNYRFMAAEALWILNGDNRLTSLTPWNSRMAEFSDDGKTLAGAYGPRILSQIAYVTGKLLEDRDTRQATLTIWTPNPEPSKDTPCTVAMDFKIRDDRLDLHVFMRSSDVWLGLPYDVFSFVCVAYQMITAYNYTAPVSVGPGTLYLTAASSHLYEEHWAKDVDHTSDWHMPTPDQYWTGQLTGLLHELRDSASPSVRWWL